MAWPDEILPDLPGCTVRALWVEVGADRAGDEDSNPDAAPRAGVKGTLKPSISGPMVYDRPVGPDMLRPIFNLRRISVAFDERGVLCKDDPSGALIPLIVPPTDDPLMSRTGWTWTLEAGGLTIGPFSAPSSGEIDLSDFVLAPATDATKSWIERIPELVELLTGAGVDPEAIAAAVADYLAANPVEGVTVADVLAEIAAHEGEADPHPQYVTDDELPDVSDVVREGDSRLTDARTPTAHGHVVDEVSGLATVATSGSYGDLTGTPTIPDSPDDIGAAPATQPINAQTTAYTLVASDAGKLVAMTLPAAGDLTVPSGVFTAGQRVDVLDLGAERVTFVAGAGMDLDGAPSLVSRAQFSAHSVIFLSASEAVVVGDLA